MPDVVTFIEDEVIVTDYYSDDEVVVEDEFMLADWNYIS